MKNTHRLIVWFFLLIMMSGFYGCRSISNRMIAKMNLTLPEVPGSFRLSGNEGIPDRFWEAFGDEHLNDLVEKALRENFSLKSAWARLKQAQANARKAGAPRWPELSGTGEAQRIHTVTNNETNGTQTTDTNAYSLGLIAGYELDLWGRVAASARAAGFDVYGSKQDVMTAAITLAAEVSDTWYALVNSNALVRALTEQIETSKQYVELVELRKRLRADTPIADLLQQQQQLEEKRGELIQVIRQGENLKTRLEVLVGAAPGTFEPPELFEVPELPSLPETGLPAELLKRRPDVRAAEMRLAAANERLRSAVADRFPRISLTARTSTETEHIRDLFDNWLANIAAELVAPLFEGGLLKAEADRNAALTQEAFYTYAQTILESVAEVEDALANETRQTELIESFQKQLQLARKVVDQTVYRYRNGAMDYLRVLDALESRQRLELQYLYAFRQRIQYRINLYRALAGGWQMLESDQKAFADGESRKNQKNTI